VEYDTTDTPLHTLGGQNHENCRHRRHRPHRIKARQETAGEGSRSHRGRAQYRRQHHHGRGTERGALRRTGRRRSGERAGVGGHKAVLEFFETSGRNLMAAEKAAGVKHHLALSIVGSDRSPDSGYLRAKVAQENLIKASRIPYTILRSTQFFEFVGGIVKSGAEGDLVRLSPALFQPIASDDVVANLAELTLAPPLNGTVEVAGPEAYPMDKFARKFLAASGDQRKVIADVHWRY